MTHLVSLDGTRKEEDVGASADLHLGQRVKLSAHAVERGILDNCPHPVFGTVAGFARNPAHVWVRRDGVKVARSYHRDFWEPVSGGHDPASPPYEHADTCDCPHCQ